MTPQPSTMPESKFRTVKKREKPLRSIRTSEFAAELRDRESQAKLTLAPSEVLVPAPAAVAQQPAVPATIAAKIESKVESNAESKAFKKPKKDEKNKFGIASFWPLAVGIFLSGFASEWQAIATQAGIGVLRFTFPFALLAAHREIGIDAQMATVMPQMALYAQLPLDGILLMLSLARSKSLKTAIVQVTAVHAVCAFVLWLVATGAK